MIYRISVPRLGKELVMGSISIGLIGALALLDEENGERNMVIDTEVEADSEGRVLFHTQFNDKICVEVIEE